METNQQASKIELIMGDLIRLLVELGADSSVLGPVAVMFPAKVAQRMGAPDKPVEGVLEPQIAEIIERTVAQRLEQLLGAAGSVRDQSIRDQVAADGSTVRVKVPAGETRTSITLPKSLIDAAERHFGNKRRANVEIRDLFTAAPATVKNRSRWVREELIKKLEKSAVS
jgi:hypothetical protein